MTRILLALSCLAAAIACYIIGVPGGGVMFLILGVIFEVLFWFGLFGRKRRQ
ncbi:MAG: hypothetical protein ACQEQ8_05555 [Pseudomonadota bacterium]